MPGWYDTSRALRRGALGLAFIFALPRPQGETLKVVVPGSPAAARAATARAFSDAGFAIARSDELSLTSEPLALYPGKMDQSTITVRATFLPADTLTEVRLTGTYRIAYAGESRDSGDLPLTSHDKSGVARQGWKRLLGLQSSLTVP